MTKKMLAVIQTGGKQYLVSPGEKIRIEKLEASVGEKVNFNEVLLFQEEENLSLGSPFLENIEVVGEVVEEGRDKKKIIFKHKPKKRYKLKKGHRQHYTEVKIVDFSKK
jgi:large subunit ribosomal protein L21